MTALKEFQRLESTGIWRAAPDEQRRDVFIQIGDATLVVYDKAGRALAHWSLAATERLNPGKSPALFSPGPEAPEELEIADSDFVTAIEKVHRAIERRRPHKGRLRLVIMSLFLAVLVGLAVFWLPDALVRYTAALVPDTRRAELGQRMLGSIGRVAGAPCETASGRTALDRLHTRLFPGVSGGLLVLSGGVATTRHLPGGLILLNRALVEDHEDPSVAAGFALVESLRIAEIDPVWAMLDHAGPIAALRLLTSGNLPDRVLADYAETLMARPETPVPDQTVLAAFAEAGLASSPYAYAVDISGETTLSLIEADPARAADFDPVLSDADWVSLQSICGA